jgi:hypothetical protein
MPAAETPAPTTQPSRRLLTLARKLIDYSRELAATSPSTAALKDVDAGARPRHDDDDFEAVRPLTVMVREGAPSMCSKTS